MGHTRFAHSRTLLIFPTSCIICLWLPHSTLRLIYSFLFSFCWHSPHSSPFPTLPFPSLPLANCCYPPVHPLSPSVFFLGVYCFHETDSSLRETQCHSLSDSSSTQHSTWFMSVLNNHQLDELITVWPCIAGFYGTERNRFQVVPEDRGFAGFMTIFSLVNTRHSINTCWMNELKDKFNQNRQVHT